jgi:hypothetical protein
LPCFHLPARLYYANPIKATDISPPPLLWESLFCFLYSIRAVLWSQGEQQMQDRR